MKIKFDKQYLPMLAEFAAKQSVRYYLNGFHIKPHPDQGVILTATDGHRLVTIHDEHGFTDGEYIFPITKGLLAASKKNKIENICGLQNVMILNGQAMVTAMQCDEGEWPNEIDSDHAALVGYVEFSNPIEGNFPNAGSLFGRLGQPKGTDHIGLNTAYLASLNSLKWSGLKFHGAKIFLYGSDNAIVAVTGMSDEIVVMIMPMRMDIDERLTDIPEFAALSGHQPIDDSAENSKEAA